MVKGRKQLEGGELGGEKYKGEVRKERIIIIRIIKRKVNRRGKERGGEEGEVESRSKGGEDERR